MHFEYELLNAMRQWDLHLNTVNLETGKYHRFRSIGTCKTKCCEYRIFENQLGAHFKCFRRGIDRFWFAESDNPPTYQQKYAMQLERDRVTKERYEAYAKASARCVKFIQRVEKSFVPPLQHIYVQRKRIYPHQSALVRGMAVVTIHDIFGEVMSLQFIKANGFKQFKTGAPVSGGMIWLGGYLPKDYSGIVRLCEGWSTGCTIHSITRSPVICALNAYNLVKVANLLRTHFINAHVRICADNDQWKDDNVGLRCAKEASLLTGYAVTYPTFENFPTFNRPTDFNDLWILGGGEAVKNQLQIIRKISL